MGGLYGLENEELCHQTRHFTKKKSFPQSQVVFQHANFVVKFGSKDLQQVFEHPQVNHVFGLWLWFVFCSLSGYPGLVGS